MHHPKHRSGRRFRYCRHRSGIAPISTQPRGSRLRLHPACPDSRLDLPRDHSPSHGGNESCEMKPPHTAAEQGQATVEMVVSLTAVFALVFWLFELSLLAYTCSVLNDAAQEGVRYAMMHGTD